MSANIRVPTSPTRKGQPHVDHQKPSVPSSFQIGISQPPRSSEERVVMSYNMRSALASSATPKAPMSQRGHGSDFGIAPILAAGLKPNSQDAEHLARQHNGFININGKTYIPQWF
ncbi:hypothetical protein EDB19DRAFT_1921205 [Suillus lakei]|nr:hypothetical protein EDB19DRAFT_1921205 [Suillus lakei]